MPEFIKDALHSVRGAIGTPLGKALSIFFPTFIGYTGVVLGSFSAALAKDQSEPAVIGSLGRLTTLRAPISDWQIIYGRRRVSGVYTFFDWTAGDTTTTMPTESGLLARAINAVATGTVSQVNKYLHLIVTWAGHKCDAIEEIYFDDELVWTADYGYGVIAKYAGVLEVTNDLGTDDGSQPFSALASRSSAWTADHRQDGRTKTYFRLTWNEDLFPYGIPNITAKIRGVKDIYDPRSSSRGYTDNVALCAAHYLENAKWGLGASFADEIDTDQLTTAANDCDADVALAAGGSEDRFDLSAQVLASEQPIDILEMIANAMAGRIADVGGKWRIFAGVYAAPAVTLDEGDLAGGIEIQSMIEMQENANSVKGTFADPANAYQETEFPALESDTYIAEDNDVQQWREMRLYRCVASVTQAERLAKIELLRTRQPLSFQAPFKLSALQVFAGTTFAFSFAKYGWVAKAWECSGFSFQIANGNELVIGLAGRETAASVYDWDSSEEQDHDAAPNTNLPDPFTIGTPGKPVVAESKYETRASVGVKTQVTVSWAAAADAQAERYQLRYKLHGDPASDAYYIVLAPTPGLWDVIMDVEPGIYDFEVRAISFAGVRSGWVQTTKEIIGLADIPEDLTGLSLQAFGGAAYLHWDLHPALDVREGGWIEFRHSDVSSGATWEESFSIGQTVAGNQTQTALPLKPGSYLARPFDSSGHPATNATIVVTKQSSVFNFVGVASVVEDPDFLGTHDGTVGVDSVLKLAGGGPSIDSWADFDAVSPFIDSYGGTRSEGTYWFLNALDLGSVQRVRLTSQIAGFIANVNDLIDSRTGEVDDWVDWDGTAGVTGDAWVEVAETDNDPASSPAWSDWKRLDAAEFNARAFKFRARLQTDDDAYNVHVETLRVAAAMVY